MKKIGNKEAVNSMVKHAIYQIILNLKEEEYRYGRKNT